VIFEQRLEIMDEEDLTETVNEMRHEVIEDMVALRIPKDAYAEKWDIAGLKDDILTKLNLVLPVEDWAKEEGIAEEEFETRIKEAADKAAAEKAERFGAQIMTYIEKSVIMQSLDNLWREHLVNLDHLRSVVGFRGYAQRDPLNEYKTEGFELFQALLANLREVVITQLMRVEIVREAPPEPELPPMTGRHIDSTTGENDFDENAWAEHQQDERVIPAGDRDPADPTTWGKVSRNEACPCGSGKKYKHCHGAFE
jgi:preprotein translocase subunit SecA